MTLFDRRVAVTVGSKRFEGERLEAGVRIQGFRLQFKVEQTLSADTNTAQATISNLSESTRGEMMNFKNPGFAIEAGYEGSSGLVFKGIAEKIIHKRTAPGFETVCDASDGSKEGKKVVNASLAPGAEVAQVIELLARTMGVSAQRVIAQAKTKKFDGPIKSFLHGYSISGTSKHEMEKLARALGIRWTIVDGELVFLKPGEATTEEFVLLSAETGLIGTPERVIDKKRPKKTLFGARSLLQSKLKPGRGVELISKEITGLFRVERATHFGDTHGGDWYSDAHLEEIKP